MNSRGEWDFLLTSVAIAAGHAPDAVLGSVHGFELGSYLMAALVALPVALGADPPATAKVLAMGLGALVAGSIGWLAAWFAVRTQGVRRASLAIVGLALVVACAWPGLHYEYTSLSGNTLESFALQIVAACLVITVDPAVGWRRPLGVGVLFGLGALLSPVAVWSSLALGLAGMALVDGWRARGRLLVAALGGVGLVFIGFVVLVPGGAEGMHRFLVEQLSGYGMGPSNGAPPGLGIVWLVHRSLESGSHNFELSLRWDVLAALGWLLVVVLGLALVGRGGGAARLGVDRLPLPPASPSTSRRARLLALVAVSWILPLMALPGGRWFYPLAFRYWVFSHALAFALLPAVLLRHGRAGAVVGVVTLLAALALVPTLPRTLVAPVPSRGETLVAATAHAMEARPGRDRHAAFFAVVPHARSVDQPALSEGYGMRLGGDEAQWRTGASPIDWAGFAAPLPEPSRTRFLVGVGCGMTVLGVPDARMLATVRRAPREMQDAVWWGLGRCTSPPQLDGLRDDPAFAAGRTGRSYQGIRSSVPDPRDLVPPRW